MHSKYDYNNPQQLTRTLLGVRGRGAGVDLGKIVMLIVGHRARKFELQKMN
jgi:hypothetical protein